VPAAEWAERFCEVKDTYDQEIQLYFRFENAQTAAGVTGSLIKGLRELGMPDTPKVACHNPSFGPSPSSAPLLDPPMAGEVAAQGN
jgi:hypothetical protein